MAVTSFTETGEGRKGSYRREGKKLVLTLDRTWDVFTDSDGTGQLEIMCDPRCPRMNSSYLTPNEFISVVYAQSIDVDQDGGNPFQWKVRVGYSSNVELELAGSVSGGGAGNNTGGGGGGGGQLIADPLKRRAVVSFSTRVRNLIAEKDHSDPRKAYVTSAGEKYDPPIEINKRNQVISITKNTANYDENIAGFGGAPAPYLDSVNSVRYNFQRPKANGVLPPKIVMFPRTSRITEWRCDEREENAVVFYENHLEIEIQHPDWDLEILNQGSKSFTFSPNALALNGLIQQYDNGTALSGMTPLDKNGLALPNTSTAVNVAIAAGVGVVVTPKSMTNISVGDSLIINDEGLSEEVVVTAIAATTFTATFVKNHAATATRGVTIKGKPTYKLYRPHPLVAFGDIPILNPL